jgi:hypothetical protein
VDDRVSLLDELLGVLGLVGAQQAGLRTVQLPACGDAVRAGQAVPGQGCFDPAADFGLGRGFGGEEHAEPHLVAGALRAGTVRRERAGRFMLLVPAERDGDGAARCPHVAARLHGHDSVVDECLAHRISIRPRRRRRQGKSMTGRADH